MRGVLLAQTFLERRRNGEMIFTSESSYSSEHSSQDCVILRLGSGRLLLLLHKNFEFSLGLTHCQNSLEAFGESSVPTLSFTNANSSGRVSSRIFFSFSSHERHRQTWSTASPGRDCHALLIFATSFPPALSNRRPTSTLNHYRTPALLFSLTGYCIQICFRNPDCWGRWLLRPVHAASRLSWRHVLP